MIKRTSRKIAAHIYWIAATFIFLALIAIPLLIVFKKPSTRPAREHELAME